MELFLVVVCGIAIYFAPWIVAGMRGARNQAGIVVLNIFLGWTLIGWVGALVWAVIDPAQEVERRQPKPDHRDVDPAKEAERRLRADGDVR